MENEKKEYTINFGRGKKKKINPKKAMYLFNLLFIALLIGVMTFANLIIDPKSMDKWQWLTRTLILVGILIPSIILGELMSSDRQKDNPDGLYQQALKRLKEDLISIKDIKIYFSQFFFWFKQEENERMRRDFLMSNEFDGLEAEYIVKYVRKEDIPELREHPIKKTDKNGKEIIIKTLNEEKAQIVLEMLKGKLDVKEESYAYYLSSSENDGASMSILQEGNRISKQRSRSTRRDRFLKITSFVIFSAIWAMVTVDSASDMGATQTWLNLISRLSAMAGGLTSGWLTGITSIKLLARELDTKSEVLETFKLDFDKGIFKPKTYEELAEEEEKKYEKEKEDVLKAVVEDDHMPRMIEFGGDGNG